MNLWQKLWGDGERESGADDEDFDPDALLSRAQREMQALHARNRERAVQAISQKNNLEQMVADLQKRTEALQAKAELADRRGDAVLALQLRNEKSSYEKTLETTRHSLEQAVATAEQVKAAIRREEERIRFKTAEALALQAQWRTTQVQRSLLASMVEINAGINQDVPVAERALRHARNRKLVQQAIVQRNQLRTMRDDTEKQVIQLRENAGIARQRQNDALENELLREMEQYEATLSGTKDAVARAEEVTERAISLLKSEEERLRSQGVDPASVSDEEVALYEARIALASVENDGFARRAREKRILWTSAAVAALVILLIAVTL